MHQQDVIDWGTLGNSLASDLRSGTYRDIAVEVLSRVAQLGPLGDPQAEFRRVYRFLHYNEPTRILQVIDELLSAHRQRKEQLQIRNNAWKYVVRAFDSWIGRARIFYLAAGIVEGSLRSRLDERLTEIFGPHWPQNAEAVPSSILNRPREENCAQKLAAVQRLLEQAGADGSIEEKATAFEAIREVVTISERLVGSGKAQTGAEFCSQLPFSALRAFFQTKRLWSGNVSLGNLFTSTLEDQSPLRSEVDVALKTIHEVRNEVAHYRPSGKLSFLEGLFALAKLAGWLQVDLQHVYSSIDTKMSTELSLLLESHYPTVLLQLRAEKRDCIGEECVVGEPLDVVLPKAPTQWPDGATVDGAALACLYHRVQVRTAAHKEEMIQASADATLLYDSRHDRWLC